MRRHAAELLPVGLVWAAAATALAIPVRRVVDWFVMTDELLYERLALSHSLVPTLHGQRVPLANQLYPALLGLFTGGGLVPGVLTRAHTFNAIAMTSAAVPAFLLARRMLRTLAGAYAAAALAVLVPWLVLASFVLTASVAYPAFVWAVYLLQLARDRPGPATDALALAGIVLAYLARTQFAVLFAVGVVVWALDRRRHRVLLAAIAVVVVFAAALTLAGHSPFGAYSATTHGSLLGIDTPRSLLEHAATLALALGLLPAVLGAAWLWRWPVPAVAVALLLLEVTSFDLRFGGSLPRDRYLFYAAPLLLIGFVGALEDRATPRVALAASTVVVAVGTALAPFPVFDKLNADAPAAILDDYIHRNGGAAMVVAALLLLVAIYLLARAFLPRRVVAIALVTLTAAALAAETAYAFDRLFRVDGTSGRPITLSQGGVFDWIDRTIGPNEDVTMIPYAQIAGDYWSTAAYWWDLEFWNRSVTRAAYPGNRFAEIQSTFPKLDPRFDPLTGRGRISPTRYVAQSDFDTRFRIRGATVSLTRDVRLIDAGRAWRADWTTSGLDDDGFTVPGRVVTVRVFPLDGQKAPTLRFLTFQVLAFGAETLNGTAMPANSEHELPMQVCVPVDRPATLRLRATGSSIVYGDLGGREGIGQARVRSVRIQRISLADESAAC